MGFLSNVLVSVSEQYFATLHRRESGPREHIESRPSRPAGRIHNSPCARGARAWSEFQEETRKMQHFELLPAEKITSVRRARARARERNLSSEARASDFERTP